jgi:cell division protein FtsL
MGKKRTISSKSVAGKAGSKPFLASKKAKLLLATLVVMVVASYIPAVSNQVKSINKGMESSQVRKQIEEQKAERRRLVALKAEALSPEQIGRAATKLGFIRMSARNIRGYETTENSVLPRSERAENRERPVVDTISSGVLGGDSGSQNLVLISDRSLTKQR